MSADRLRIDYVSPLPPVRSGIADYSADLLPHLSRLCDLRLVRLPGQPVAKELSERWPLTPPAEVGESGRLALYQMGNNHYHFAVHELASRQPGVLTLHDMVLHHFLIDHTVKAGDFESYRRQLEADHGWIGEAAAMPMRWPGGSGMAAQFALPAHRGLLLRQLGVLTHSEWAAETLQEEIPGLEVRTIPMGIPVAVSDEAASRDRGLAFRQRYGLPLDQPVVGCFGFQTPMKRTEVVIQALAEPGLESARLMVAGEVAPILRLEETAAAAGVADRVHILGFLPFEEFEAAILASDLCLNLRYPTAGETSASLLRILAVGRPAVVSDYAQSADLTNEGVVKVPVGDGEVAALVALLSTLLPNRDQLREMGRAARRYVEREHRPEAAARAVAEACLELRDKPPLAASAQRRQVAPPPPTSLVWSALRGELRVEGAERPWAEGERRQLVVRLRNQSAARWLAGEQDNGGVAIEVRIHAGGRDFRAVSDWIALPFDLEPGAEHAFEVDVRRPPGPARLCVLPHVLGHGSFAELQGPVWEGEI